MSFPKIGLRWSCCLVLMAPLSLWSQEDIMSMNKGELRMYAAQCQGQRRVLEAQKEVQAAELASVQSELEEQKTRLEEKGQELEEQKTRLEEKGQELEMTSRALSDLQDDFAALSEAADEISKRVRQLRLLDLAKRKFTAFMQAEWSNRTAQGAPDARPSAPQASRAGSRDVLRSIQNAGQGFGNHEFRLELAAIHVPWQIVEDPLTEGRYSGDKWSSSNYDYKANSRAFVFDRIWELGEVGLRVQKPFQTRVVLGSSEGKRLYVEGVGGEYLSQSQALKFMSWTMDVFNGKFLTMGFGNDRSEDFLLSGFEELDYRRDEVVVAAGSRSVLSLVDTAEQGIAIDLIDWNGELFLGFTPRTLNVLGSGMGFGSFATVEFGGDLYDRYYGNFEEYRYFGTAARLENYEASLSSWSSAANEVYDVDNPTYNLQFYRTRENGRGEEVLYPDLLLFRVVESGGQASPGPTSTSEGDDAAEATACSDCIPFYQLDELPRLASCGLDEGEDPVLCSDLSMMDLLEAAVAEESVTEESVVFVRFVVQSNGSISDAQVLEPVDPTLDAAAVRAVSALPGLKAARKDGLAVPVEMFLPVRFAAN